MATPALTAEKIEELRALHGRIEVVEGRKPAATAGNPDPATPWAVVYKKPSRATYKRFRAMSHRPESIADAQEMLARACCVWPETAAGFDALLEDFPGIPEGSGKALGDLAGMSADETGKL